MNENIGPNIQRYTNILIEHIITSCKEPLEHSIDELSKIYCSWFELS